MPAIRPAFQPLRLSVAIALILPFAAAVADASDSTVTFSRDVAPIFFAHCASCHRPGEVAPMSLLDYESARPWAKSIARAVANRDMPPWSGESERRRWRNDLSLDDEQIATIVGWVEQGALEGDPAQLPERPVFPEGWTLGEPDYVIELDEVAVPADGEDLFPQQTVTLELDRPRWVQAIEFLPGDRRVTHHFQALYTSGAGAGSPEAGEARPGGGVFGIWTAGMPPYVFPEGMGRVVWPGTKVLVDSHYHPFGEATTDRTRIGLYFGRGEIEKEVATMFGVNTGLRIPPGASDHAEHAFHVFDRDMQILAFSPHLHVRGKAMRYELTYPDGRSETLLDVPKYDYNWQWLYYPTAPIEVPAGSRLDVTAVWDNSADNPSNPDPSQEILYRGDTFNEMFVGFFEAVPKEGVYHRPTPALERIRALLREHPVERSWWVGGFLPFGLYLPEEGEGWIYLVQGVTMFTISADDFEWQGNRLRMTTQFPTPEASATTTVIEAEVDEQGRLQGTLRYGVDGERPLQLPLVGQPMSADDDGSTG